ncbi:hypothetical protein [Streptomyces prunicolor]|uniref:Lipoprotein n=1 Tax=Streptomyces prunicolor TaxID=67348 RepID=A0ABU4F857_9ACTN|nr:hypothetical protein [Streptomyces prunicolor]MDV7216772.1 hypothetical protein [Streptomyces prunicolor]
MALLLGSAACSSDDTKDTGTGDRTRETCQDLLGTAGERWVKESSARQTGLVDVKDLKTAKAAFYDDARSWDPSSKAVSSFLPTELCRIVVQDQKPHTSRLSISYGASVFPFDSPFGEKSDVSGASGASGDETLVRANSDVKLVVRKNNGSYDYAVYVKCRVPGAPATQETGVPLAGSMTDTLTGDTGTGPHLRYLLNSARVVAKAFACGNNPTIPTKLPAT